MFSNSSLSLGQYPDIAVRVYSLLGFIDAATTAITYETGTLLALPFTTILGNLGR